MNKQLIAFLLFVTPAIYSQGPVIFNDYFNDQTLRVDYYHTGDARKEVLTLDRIYKQGVWAGNLKSCIQPTELGLYKVEVYDTAENRMIYSKGYNSIFAEYQTITDALNGIEKTYHESVLIPCPKHAVKLVIEKRAKNNSLSPVFSVIIDPADYHILTETSKRKDTKIFPVIKNDNPHNCVDLVILGEGYTIKEMSKFKKDLQYYSHLFLNFEPYKSYARFFNLNGVFVPSEESGTDEPRQGVYRNTFFNSSFNIFDTDRYCLVEDNKSIRDIASIVSYDIILIMVNKDRYGGGGIYNWQSVFTTGAKDRDYVFLHEFAHTFAGLADEYYNSSVAYEDIFVPGIEPLEPNITELLDTANVKWKKYLTPGLKIPTEWGKVEFDSLNLSLKSVKELKNKTLADLKKTGTSESEMNSITINFDKQIKKINAQIDSFIFNHPLKGKVGVFEGANYLSKGYYRSSVNSMMQKFDPENPSYGIVNEQAIIETIKYYIEN